MRVGDEHWTKVLQANDVLGKLPVCPYHGKKLPLRCAFNDDAKTTSSGADQVSQAGDGARRRGRASCTGTEDHPPGRVSLSTETKERNGLTTLFDRFCQWLSDARRQSSLLRLPLPKSRSRRSSSLRRSPEDFQSSGRGRRPSRRRCNSASPSSSHGDPSDPSAHRDDSGSRTTSTCSSVTTNTSTSTCSDVIGETGNTGDDVAGTGSTRLATSGDDVTVDRHRTRSGYDVNTTYVLENSSGRCENNPKDEYCPLISTWPSATGKSCSCISFIFVSSVFHVRPVNFIVGTRVFRVRTLGVNTTGCQV